MGISKRNPRGNFNWQNRYLKEKGINCGQLNEPFDCVALAPVINYTGGYVLCDNGNIVTVNVTNTRPGQTTFWEWYFNGVVVSTDSFYSFDPPTPADQGMYTIVATNQFGCVSTLDVYLTYTAQPVLAIATVDPTPPACDGEISITVTNPVAGTTYVYEFWNINTNVLISNGTTSSLTGLCLGQYAVRVLCSVNTPYGISISCASDFVYVNLPTPVGPAFTLEFTSFAPIGIPYVWGVYSVTAWNNLMGTDYQICVVDTMFNKVSFYYTAGSLVMNDFAFTVYGFPNTLIGANDPTGDFVTIGAACFYGCAFMQYSNWSAVTTAGYQMHFDNLSLTTVKMPLLTAASYLMFFNCISLDDPKLPSITSIDGSFSGCTSLNTLNSGGTPGLINLANVTTMTSTCFNNCTSIVNVDAPSLITMGSQNFQNCQALETFNALNLTSMGNTNFYVIGTSLVLIDIPLCASISISCAHTGQNFQRTNGVCYDPSSNFTLNVPLSLATCNAGSYDADLGCIYALNPLVTINYV